MVENKDDKLIKSESEELEESEFLTEEQARGFVEILSRGIKSYKSKDQLISDKEWLKEFLNEELPDMSGNESEECSSEIIIAIDEFDANMESVNQAIENGISKEIWLANKIQETSVGMNVNEYGNQLQKIDDFLYEKNLEIHDSLRRNSDGHIKMSRNLDGNIAEQMLAKTIELGVSLQGSNIKVEVRDVFTPNSVDVRATNLETGKYENYQMKFGKDAKATIGLIERGNYANQQIIVPSEQLKEIQEHFKNKGSKKTIKDHIDIGGAKGKPFTKKDVKEFQILAQEDGIMPTMDYNHYQTRDLAFSIGKNAGIMSMQSAAVTMGFNVIYKLLQDEEIEVEEVIETALLTGMDTGTKVITAGALQVAVRKGIISIIPKLTPAGIIANVACVGIENAKILYKVATGDLSVVRGIDEMGRVTVSMLGGLWGLSKGAGIGIALTAWIPIIGVPLSVVTGFIGGAVGYFAGSKIFNKVYSGAKKVGNIAKEFGRKAVESVNTARRSIVNKGKELLGLFK